MRRKQNDALLSFNGGVQIIPTDEFDILGDVFCGKSAETKKIHEVFGEVDKNFFGDFSYRRLIARIQDSLQVVRNYLPIFPRKIKLTSCQKTGYCVTCLQGQKQ